MNDSGVGALLGFLVTIILIVAFIAALGSIGSTAVMTANGIGKQIEQASASVIQAQADAKQSEIAYQNRQREYDLQVRSEAAAKEAEARIAKIEADKNAEVQRVQAQSAAAVKVAQASSKAQSDLWRGFGAGGALLLVLVATGAGLYALGFGVGRGINQVALANYVRIGVEPITMLPPPLIITWDGYLIDTRSGERARLRDAAGVNRLKLAATTRNTETAQLARAVTDAAKATKSTTATQDLPLISASVQTMETVE